MSLTTPLSAILQTAETLPPYYKDMQIPTDTKRQVVDITGDIAGQLPEGKGIVNILVLHTTAAITTADLDPGTDQDFLDFLAKITPEARWRHPHDPAHAPDHLLASLIGPSLTLPYENGKLELGAWQRVVLIELDGPRDRNLAITPLARDG